MKKAFMNWSSGKDSGLALHKIIREKKFKIDLLLTTISELYERISMHGVRKSLLEKQAESIGIPLQLLPLPENLSMEEYNGYMSTAVEKLKKDGIMYSVFGDIFLEDLKIHREQNLIRVGMSAVFPLWKNDSTLLLNEFIESGFKAIIVCVNDKHFDSSFLGREIGNNFLNELPAAVDACGENGEYHTFLYDGPIFKYPVKFDIGEIVHKKYKDPDNSHHDTGFWYLDLKEQGQ